MEIWFWIANGQILSICDRIICPRHDDCGILSFHIFILQWSTQLCLVDTSSSFFRKVNFQIKGSLVYFFFLILFSNSNKYIYKVLVIIHIYDLLNITNTHSLCCPGLKMKEKRNKKNKNIIKICDIIVLNL